ncbi:MAG: glucans biosynthesis glucosyltransferase MdoH, partial [Caulobacter sp.]|nr:glucans biosynthesis glucosyltransferase MdoH [Caulobacter sp.]
MDGTSNLARRYEPVEDYGYGYAPLGEPWLPAESPLDMPRQSFGADAPRLGAAPATSPGNIALRRLALFSASWLLTFVIALTPFQLYMRDGFTALEGVALGLFVVLVGAISTWFCSAVAGFVVLKNRREDIFDFPAIPPTPRVRTALLMPLYNEDPAAVLARLARVERSLAGLGVAHWFDLFVLSDTTNEAVAAQERVQFSTLRARSRCRTFYRRRPKNTERKAGNISDWVSRFGGAYEHMIILDADSVMSGETVVKLVDAMERHPGVGLLQTTPVIIGAETLYARAQQFSVRMFGKVAAAGLAWWTGAESSYWGHNAIVRVKAFAACSGLPVLPGKKPFGGHILSHDVVEAALLRRGGWAVHVTPVLDGSTEETPPSMIEFMKRDRRWAQGNLQHLGLLFAPGLHPISRLQLFFGMLCYLVSPVWMLSLLTGLAIQAQITLTRPEYWRLLAPVKYDPIIWASVLTVLMLIGPKVLGLILTLSRPEECKAFGGRLAILKSAAFETAYSAVMAPVMMVGHTRIVLEILSGKDAGWTAQTRDGETLNWPDAFRAHRWEINTGLLFAAILTLAPHLTIWFAPIILPLIASPFIAVLTSRRDLGAAAGRMGLLVTPEEVTERSEVVGAPVHQLFPAVTARRADEDDLELPETSVFWPSLIAAQHRAQPIRATV